MLHDCGGWAICAPGWLTKPRKLTDAHVEALRHTYRTICADLEIDELISHYLMGHAPQGISQKYIATLILQNGPAMRAAQERISKRMVSLLGLMFGGHDDAPLAPKMPNRVASKARA